jgi:DNA adenine methylase
MYCEPFVGGAAVFFGKERSPVEVINDTNSELINFYKVAQNNFPLLEKEVKETLHSRDLHKDASVVYNFPHLFSEVKRAWSIWVLSTQSFAAQLDSSWGFDKISNTTTQKISNKRAEFTDDIKQRLHNVQIECADAVYIIQSRDTNGTFFYCDPPYFNSDCGHYDGYSERDFEELLITLAKIKGKFLLSSYPSDILKKYSAEFGWSTRSIEQNVSVNAKSGYQKRKVEVFTTNY